MSHKFRCAQDNSNTTIIKRGPKLTYIFNWLNINYAFEKVKYVWFNYHKDQN